MSQLYNKDCNRGTGQHPVPRTNMSSIHPLQGQADVPFEPAEFVGDPSTSVEALECACGDGNSTYIKKCQNSKCKLANNFKPSDKVSSTVTHRLYPCVNHEGPTVATCNTSNVIYLITCSTCHLQYVGETAQNLNIRFAKHRLCMSGNINSKSCKHVSDHFSKGFCKNSEYTVQIIENLEGNGRTSRGALDPGVSVIRRKRETEWMLKLRTVFPYGLNDRVDIADDNNKFSKASAKLGEDLIAKIFPKVPRKFNRNPNNRHKKHNRNINFDIFIKQLEYWIKNDLPNAPNHIRVALSSMKKKHLKSVADYISDFLSQQDSSYLFSTWYSMALDIIESKLFVEPVYSIKKTLPKYKLNMTFVNKALDYINLPSILRQPEIINNCPFNINEKDIPMVVYSLSQPVRSKIFNYHTFVNNLNLNEFVNNKDTIRCCCHEFDQSFTNDHHGHIVTGDLRIVKNNKLRKIISKGPKFREPMST